MFKKIILSVLFGLIFTARALSQNVDYYLPYPGLLPDHPLYWMKMVRDRLGLLVVTKPEAKAEKLLLYADKRLGAAWALVDGNKVGLGVSTLTKAEKYLEQAVAAGQGEEFKQKLAKAIAKHGEVIGRLKAGVTGESAAQLDAMLSRLEALKDGLGTGASQSIEVQVDFGGDSVVIKNLTATTALEALENAAAEEKWPVIVKDYDFGKLVIAVADKANSKDKAWIYYVNGTAADKAGDKFDLKAGDKVEWKYEKVKP